MRYEHQTGELRVPVAEAQRMTSVFMSYIYICPLSHNRFSVCSSIFIVIENKNLVKIRVVSV